MELFKLVVFAILMQKGVVEKYSTKIYVCDCDITKKHKICPTVIVQIYELIDIVLMLISNIDEHKADIEKAMDNAAAICEQIILAMIDNPMKDLTTHISRIIKDVLGVDVKATPFMKFKDFNPSSLN